MELDIVEGEILGDTLNFLQTLIDEYPYTLALCGQIGRAFADITAGLWSEDKPHKVYSQSHSRRSVAYP